MLLAKHERGASIGRHANLALIRRSASGRSRVHFHNAEFSI
jgi:hypothetical protein